MKPRVLIVDDSATVRADLRVVLGAAGFSTLLCGGIGGARKALSEERFDLVILDVLLQDGDGVDLLMEMRAHERTSQVPVLLLSSESAVGARLRGLSEGASDYVGKPYDSAFVVKRARELIQSRPPPPKAAEPEPPLVAAARRRRLLVVDDSPTFLQAVVEELRQDGHDLIPARSAEEALPLLEAQPVDCVLMDLMLPGMDGISATRIIRSRPALASVPVLMFTSRFESQKMAEALNAGVDAFCPKASDLGLLRAQVRNLLRRQSPEAESAPPAKSASAPKPPEGSALMERVVARSGLSPVIASSTIARACRRASVEPQQLSIVSLTQALPFIRDALRVFLTEHETRQRMADIEELTRDGHLAVV
ncbi:response regulator [Stigmatella sp. ncwal1]|uniref:Response regulator n=1 Tax=Stigmatella ashevillensis TaxID=2995309 RepID=A0ABT5DIY9_9BACT|nr:response regulator [Stigmatella ashevillena]MDC0712321.1 response regulator [Stigmatella ashevillena]